MTATVDGTQPAPYLRIERLTKQFGAFSALKDVSLEIFPDGVIESANDLGVYLLRHAGVAVLPGEGFGAPKHIRLSYAAPLTLLEEGVRRIRDGLARLG